MPSHLALVFLVLLVPLTSSEDLEYSELEETGMACPPRDTCQSRSRKRDFRSTNCECDSQCIEYDDCCVDSKYRQGSKRRRDLKVTCLKTGFGRGVYVIDRCPSEWKGSDEVKRNCEAHRQDLRDPLLEAPATDTANNLTYRNHHCAECNEPRGQLVSWTIQMKCHSLRRLNETLRSITEDFVIEHLQYSEQEKKWGVLHASGGQPVFHSCDVTFLPPSYVENHVRPCRPDVISECSSDWVGASVTQKCEAYTAVVYIGEEAYKNPHCAVCNSADSETLQCSLFDFPEANARSFIVLFDLNGKTSENKERCPSEGEKYDAIFKKCRKLWKP